MSMDYINGTLDGGMMLWTRQSEEYDSRTDFALGLGRRDVSLQFQVLAKPFRVVRNLFIGGLSRPGSLKTLSALAE